MPEYILDSRGRRRSVTYSVAECGEILERIAYLRRELKLEPARTDPEGQAVEQIMSRLRGACAAKGKVLKPAGGGPAAPLHAEACGPRVVNRKGKTVACVLTLKEQRLLLDELDDLEDSLELQEAMEGPPEERIPLDEVLSRYGLSG
jgi:hypothetical protein